MSGQFEKADSITAIFYEETHSMDTQLPIFNIIAELVYKQRCIFYSLYDEQGNRCIINIVYMSNN